MIPKVLCTVCSLAAVAGAQPPPASPVSLPTFTAQQSPTSIPFGTTRIRWQMWFSADQVAGAIGRPVRIQQLDFLTPTGGQTGHPLQLELRVASRTAFPSSSFQTNLAADETLVFSAGAAAPFMQPTTQAGAYALQFPFATEFVWDGVSGLVVEVRIYDNGNFNQPFQYDLAVETPFAGQPVAMLWNDTNNPSATGANRFVYRAPRIRLQFQDGVSLDFGAGCAGQGNSVPVASTLNGPARPANLDWTHRLTNASSQRQAIWMFGDSNQTWETVTLPFTLELLGAPNCALLVKPDLTFTTTTVGGGPGAGTASLRTAVPPVTSIVGMSFYTQWLVLDPLAINGVLAASNGQWHVIGP